MKSLLYKILFFLLIIEYSLAIPQPGEKYFVDIDKLAEPYATKSVANTYKKLDSELCKLNVNDGFKVNIFAKNLQHPRNIKVAGNGDVFIVESNPGKIKILRDNDNDGISDIEQVFADGFNYPFGIEITSDFLYVADLDFVWKIPYKEGQLKNDKDPIKLTKDNALGDINGHRTRNIVLLDNKIYIAIGSRGNIGVEDYPRATIQEFDLKTNEQKNFATGLRNPIGLDVHPVTKKLFTVVNERDGMGDELVPDYFAQVEEGDFFGWPFFYLGHNEQPNLEKNYFYFKNIEQKKNKLVKKPEVLFKSHSGPIDLIFYNKKQFPKEFQSNAFVALHGSWNSSKPSGYMVVRIPFENNKPLGYYESFVTGFWVSDANRANVCGRPAGLGVTKNGSLLISDDINGVIYQINSN
ncbi:MAG: sorbosone dehydrogenase [Pelagibacteraceae bacterium]|nr:sorbosone dehydrogenase [Pelagibacteraceae bacterium]|tara:strand:+ start:9703 stop:10929 length:1227 start_codon:yes stop_codon:yes gene_type:complete